MLSAARVLEQRIRDTLSMNIGNMSLKESRRSSHQSDSVGRLSFLGFVFLPLSLVMSFFGMNIGEITGSGASWRVFVFATATLCLITTAVFVYMWRRSPRVLFIASIPHVLLAFLIGCPFGITWQALRFTAHQLCPDVDLYEWPVSGNSGLQTWKLWLVNSVCWFATATGYFGDIVFAWWESRDTF